MGSHPFFYSDAGREHGLIDMALELAIAFKCSPEYFLTLTGAQLSMLYDRAVVAFNKLKAADK